MVVKPNGSFRPCRDYGLVNNMTTPNSYSVPNIKDFSAWLAGCKVFSTLDLCEAYWQVPVAKSSKRKTAVMTPFGVFIFQKMPFGLKNAGSTFQRLKDNVLAGLPSC